MEKKKKVMWVLCYLGSFTVPPRCSGASALLKRRANHRTWSLCTAGDTSILWRCYRDRTSSISQCTWILKPVWIFRLLLLKTSVLQGRNCCMTQTVRSRTRNAPHRSATQNPGPKPCPGPQSSHGTPSNSQLPSWQQFRSRLIVFESTGHQFSSEEVLI